MDLKKFLKSKKWHLLGKWKHGALSEQLVCRAIVNKQLSASVPSLPEYYIVINHKQFVAEQDFRQNVAETKETLVKDPVRFCQRLKAEISGAVAKFNSFKVVEFDRRSFEEFMAAISRHGRQWYEIMVTDAVLQELYPQSLPAVITLNEQEFTWQKLFALLALPKKVFPMIAERKHLLQMAVALAAGHNIEAELARHVNLYSWMNSVCLWEEPFTIEHYRKEAEQLVSKEPTEELEDMEEKRREQYQTAESLLIEMKKKYPIAWLYLDIIRELADLKEENWDAVSIAGARTRPAWKRLAAKYYLSYNQFMMLTVEEVLALLARGRLSVDTEILNLRIKQFASIHWNGDSATASGEEVTELSRLVEGDAPKTDVLTGTIIWPGYVKGKAKILYSVDDVAKMGGGEVLVCPMTDPDYMPAIHRAKAVITDQGGLLCHAAIVAREFRIPCIVGTEIATKIFKDGDLLEVDAERGIVRKI